MGGSAWPFLVRGVICLPLLMKQYSMSLPECHMCLCYLGLSWVLLLLISPTHTITNVYSYWFSHINHCWSSHICTTAKFPCHVLLLMSYILWWKVEIEWIGHSPIQMLARGLITRLGLNLVYSMGDPSPPLSTQVDTDVIHVIKWTLPSPSVFAYCKESKTGQWEGLRMRLNLPTCTVDSLRVLFYWFAKVFMLCGEKEDLLLIELHAMPAKLFSCVVLVWCAYRWLPMCPMFKT